MVRVGEWITLKGSKAVYEVAIINYLDQKVSIRPITNTLKSMGYFSINMSDLKDITILGHPVENPTLRMLYG